MRKTVNVKVEQYAKRSRRKRRNSREIENALYSKRYIVFDNCASRVFQLFDCTAYGNKVRVIVSCLRSRIIVQFVDFVEQSFIRRKSSILRKGKV